MHGVVAGGAGADRRRRVVDGASDDLRPRRQPQGLGRLRRQRPEHVGALDDLRQLVGIDAAGAHEAGVVLDVVRVAVVGDPAGEDRVEGGDEAPGEPQVQVVLRLQERARLASTLRNLCVRS